VGEAQLTRNGSRGGISRIAMDFQTMNMNKLKSDFYERRGRFGDQSLIDIILVDPVTNFQLAFAQTRV